MLVPELRHVSRGVTDPAAPVNAVMADWSEEETADPLYADRRNFYKVEKWSRIVIF